MNTEQLINKGVKKHFNGQIVLFVVASLLEHFDGITYHDSDIVPIQEWEGDELVGTIDCIKASDVNFDFAVAKEVVAVEDESYENSEEGTKGIVTELTPEEADALIKAENAKLGLDNSVETLNDNPELVDEGVNIGDTIVVDAEEVKSPEVTQVVVEKMDKTIKAKK